MDFAQSQKSREWTARVARFMDENVYPAIPVFEAQYRALDPWKEIPPIFEELKANLVPGMILQPNGVYAVLRAQEAGCAFMRST